MKLNFIICVFLKILYEFRIVAHLCLIYIPSNCPCITKVEAITKVKEVKKEEREGGKKRKNKRHNKRRRKIKLINVPGIPAYCYT